MSDSGPRVMTGKFKADQTDFSTAGGSSGLHDAAQTSSSVAPAECPRSIGRYRVERLLGKGGFGRVYLAFDELLQRRVAVKVPYADRISGEKDAEQYLKEARLAASLTHLHIVPVYDVGSTEQFPCFVVSKYIEGHTLSRAIKRARPSPAEAAEVVAAIADALHYAHMQGIVHRDVKPGNILIDRSGQPFVVDFGVALREQDAHDAHRYSGTPAYMSPEQARGEGHRVDGRSDVFSLGVVLYELLAGQKPFKGASRHELLQQTASVDPMPPRLFDDGVSKELERICLKAISKRAADRYATAKELADDLRHLLKETPLREMILGSRGACLPAAAEEETAPIAAASPGLFYSSTPPLQVVPKGLRSFDEYDADFFLDLLPGPRDRRGLPDSIRFWKTAIEEADADKTFSVGLIYGPSGCGKSSLVKAGLLPRLSDDVVAVYLEAAADETETRLLNALRKRFPALDRALDLKDSLQRLRQGHGLPAGKKTLIVLDQFEQWLHVRKQDPNAELVQALRQCDGAHLQCIVVVRDDFWLAISRFLGEAEVELAERRNFAFIDLFDLEHARKVLQAFGQALGRLPEKMSDASPEQNEFVSQAIAGLAENRKIISIRLALFAQMMSGVPWTPAALKAVGGAGGVGVTFLEETFNARTNPKHRLHQKAARSVLNALLPEFGADLKGHMRAYGELLEASGYADRPKDFEELIGILDGELRLITPTDPEGSAIGEGSQTKTEAGQKYYQLTHDFLVPELRNWIARKRTETARGRAQLRLNERVQMWQIRRERRQLPSFAECATILAFTSASRWTEKQRQMMKQALRLHGLRWGTALLIALTATIAALAVVSVQRASTGKREAELLVDAVLTAPAQATPHAIENLRARAQYALPILQRQFEDESNEWHRRLHAAVTLAEFEQVELEFLVAAIAKASPEECGKLVGALKHDRDRALRVLREQAAKAEASQDWEQKSRLAVVSLGLGESAPAQQMLRLAPDPDQRSVFIDVIPAWHGSPDQFLHTATASNDPAFLSGVCLGLGSAVGPGMPSEGFRELERDIAAIYWTHPNHSVHSAAGWHLRRLRSTLLDAPPERASNADRQWSVNSLGMTMLVIPPGSFSRKTQIPDPNQPQRTETREQIVEITRGFLLGDREVSRRHFEQFIDDPDCPASDKPEDWTGASPQRSPTLDHPVQYVSWRDAALFCNWLSRKEGLKPCYSADGVLAPDADGYRLPWEAEWEYACRAGTVTAFSFGDDESRSHRYAVCEANRTGSCGSLLPNGWGLFDMHGNVYEWCQDFFAPYNGASRVSDPVGPGQGTEHVLRGGAFDYEFHHARSGAREKNLPDYRSYTIGFRLARSLP